MLLERVVLADAKKFTSSLMRGPAAARNKLLVHEALSY
jgi:hypothetical protein